MIYEFQQRVFVDDEKRLRDVLQYDKGFAIDVNIGLVLYLAAPWDSVSILTGNGL